jgi:transposase
MTTPTVYLGIDVAKASLELAGAGLRLQVPNHAEGHAEILRAARRLSPAVHFVCEATGGYERRLVAFLLSHDCAVSLLQPSWARAFARSTGQLAKTDRIDAAMLAEYGLRHRPAPEPKPVAILEEMTDIVRRRAQLAELLGVQRTQRQQLHDARLIKQLDRLITVLERQVAELERRLDKLIDSDAGLGARLRQLCEVEGVGRTTAVSLIAELPELGSANRAQIAALAGLAPINWDTGKYSGQRHIRGGRRQVRRALYMAAITAIRCNPILGPYYRRLRERGKLHRVAIIAVMRKLLIHLNRILTPAQLVLASQHS